MSFSRAAAAVAIVALAAGCTDLRLARFRDDRLVATHRYALGERELRVDGVRIVYQEFGEGPTVLIVPGLATSVDFWQLVVPEMARHFRVVALDPPGFGKSDKPDVRYDLPWIAERIVKFADGLGLGRFSIVGGSLGGHLGLLIALEHPERVEKLVMMGSTGAWPPPGLLLDTGLKLLWNEWVVTDFLRGRWPEIFDKMFESRSALTEAIFRYQMAIRADGPRYAPEGRASARALKSIFYHSCRSRLGELRSPLLLLWGEHDEIHPPDDAYYIRAHTRDSRLVLVPLSGHEVMVDQPEEFVRIVTAFLKGGTSAIEDRLGTPPKQTMP